MPSRADLKNAHPSATKEKKTVPSPAGGRFDKAFPVWLDGESGVSSGVGRNITETGMFVETREPLPLGTRVRVTFTAPGAGPTEMTLEAEVRYQCFINFARADHTRAGMRGIGLKFVAGQKPGERKGTLH
ncbi:MAG: PilZ domain-containing protein [Deltaproteobacteria bacterium]|nr:PilZ domain-containing protein [Deltaproteobacteria bacterium]